MSDATYFPKMFWCHRVIMETDGTLRFVEVSFDENNKLLGYTDPFMCSEDMAGLSELVGYLRAAMDEPVIPIADFPLPEEVTK